MKKIISLLMIAAMIFTTLPVFADSQAPVVTLKYVTDGETYEAGSSVILGAEADITGVARVDFYANGIKIPSCITSLDKTLSWTIPTSGSYEINAILTTSLGGTFESNTVTIKGTASGEKPFIKFDKADDVTQIYGKDWAREPIPAEEANSEYVRKSKFSAPFGPMKSEEDRYFTIKGLNINIGATNDPVYLNYLMYASNDIVLRSALMDYDRPGYDLSNDPETNHVRPNKGNTVNGFIPLKAGWNMLSVSVRDNTPDSYNASPIVIDTINEIRFVTNEYTIPKDYPALYGENAGKKLSEQKNIGNTVVYLDSAWVSTEPVSAPKASSSIPTGSTQVCNALDKLTFTFDKEMDFSALSDADITVKNNTDNTEIENFTLIPSTNTLIVDFTPNTLEFNKSYTVTLEDNIKDFYGKSVDSESKTFTFSTVVDSCDTVKPIVSLTYPAASSTVTSDNVTLAAKVIFGGTVSNVAFYEGETKLADAKQGADGEWYATDITLSKGTHNVTVKVTYGDTNATIEPEEATSFTVSDALNYSFTGIFDGEKIPLNETAEPLVSKTVGITPITNVSKVVYKINDVPTATVTEAPFTWDMPITAINRDVTLSADVYSVGVNAVTPVSYKAVYIKELLGSRPNHSSDFDSFAEGTMTDYSIFKHQYNDRSSAYKFRYVNVESIGGIGIAAMVDRDETVSPSNSVLFSATGFDAETGAPMTNGNGANPIVKFSFDMYLPVAGRGNIVVRSQKSPGSSEIVACDFSQLPVGKWISSEVYIDTLSKTLICNYDGKSTVQSLSEAQLNVIFNSGAGRAYLSFCTWNDLYIDNFRTSRVEVDTTRNDLFVNGIKKDVTASGEKVNVSVANLTEAEKNVSVIFALYSEDGEMIAVYPYEEVRVESGELSQKIQNVPYTVDGKIVKVFCWNNMGEITPVKTIR